MEQKIQEKIELHFKEAYELLKTIPPVKDSASVIIAEMGVNMDLFPTEMHLSSWAGMSPGNNESAGKKKPGATTHGNKHLKTILTEFAWIASRMKGTYLWSKYQSLVGRRGKKKTLVAVGHKILIMCYHILKYKVPYKELGALSRRAQEGPHCEKLHKEAHEPRLRGNSQRSSIRSPRSKDHVEEGRHLLVVKTPLLKLT